MDHFGIGAAMRGMAQVYIQSARRTGKTTSMVESVKDGDRLVFISSAEAERVRRLLLERGVEARCIVIGADRPMDLFDRGGPSEGRTIFDHGWVEQYYLRKICEAQEDLDRMQREASGFGAAHRETQRAAIELSKWRG